MRLYTENGRFAFFSPKGGFRGNVRCSRSAYWKARSRLSISVNWIFSLGVKAEALRANIDWKSASRWEPVDPKFHIEGIAPTNHSSSQKTRLSNLSYGVKIWTGLSTRYQKHPRATSNDVVKSEDRTGRPVHFDCIGGQLAFVLSDHEDLLYSVYHKMRRSWPLTKSNLLLMFRHIHQLVVRDPMADWLSAHNRTEDMTIR